MGRGSARLAAWQRLHRHRDRLRAAAGADDDRAGRGFRAVERTAHLHPGRDRTHGGISRVDDGSRCGDHHRPWPLVYSAAGDNRAAAAASAEPGLLTFNFYLLTYWYCPRPARTCTIVLAVATILLPFFRRSTILNPPGFL